MYESSTTVSNSFPIRNWEILGAKVRSCNETFQIEFKDVALWGLTSGQWCHCDPPRVGKSGLDCENSRSVVLIVLMYVWWSHVCDCNCSLMSCKTVQCCSPSPLLFLFLCPSSSRHVPAVALSVLSGAPYQTLIWENSLMILCNISFIYFSFYLNFFLEI